MGQSVNQQLGMDTDYLRSQILRQREQGFQQITNPFQQAAARLGTILGGGIANVANDRGFFEVSDPLLNKVTQIQGIYNQVAGQIDPASNPAEFYSTLQKAYADAGLGQQALMAAQEAQKATKEGYALETAKYDLFNKNPELLDKEIAKAKDAGNDAKVTELEAIKTRAAEARQLDLSYKKAQINSLDADAAFKKAQAAGKDVLMIPSKLDPAVKLPYERKNGKLVPLEIEGITDTGTTQPTKGGKREGSPLDFLAGRGAPGNQLGKLNYSEQQFANAVAQEGWIPSGQVSGRIIYKKGNELLYADELASKLGVVY